jgi:hypothetical protein
MFKKNDTTFFIFDRHQTQYFLMSLRERDLLREIHLIYKSNEKLDSMFLNIVTEKNKLLQQKDSVCNNSVQKLELINKELIDKNEINKQKIKRKNKKIFSLGITSIILASLLILL